MILFYVIYGAVNEKHIHLYTGAYHTHFEVQPT